MYIKKKKTVLLLLSVTLSITLIGFAMNVIAKSDGEVVELTKSEANGLAIENSSAIRGMDANIYDLLKAHQEMKDSIVMLKGLYALLPRYRYLYYLDPSTITPEEQIELEGYKYQFAMLGITSPNLTNKQVYDTFIYPIEVGPDAMLVGVLSLGSSIEAAKVGIGLGANQLYDTILAMEDIYTVLEMNYDMAVVDKESFERKYNFGQVSLMEYQKADNKMIIAELEMNKMAREIDNLMLSLKQMLGLSLDIELVLDPSIDSINVLEPLEDYLDSALTKRSEIETLKYSINAKEREFEYVKDYFSSSSNQYKITEGELETLILDLKGTEESIEKEMRSGYVDVLEKGNNLDIKAQDLELAENQLKELTKYYELGFVSEAKKDGIKMLVIQKENDYISAKRDYINALYAYELASGIGPGYSSSSQGGMMNLE